ncbi:GlxA family transcriptional regulator [Hoeflea sp. TYP-13]|uniref:GlxA family transcriptional regulator n=1 Tax=Hoeflea sp. TYP-13 TaxID=3230023 RepID=UPI0034C6605A
MKHIAFVLLPNFSMLPFVSALDPLKQANRLSGQSLYRWSTYTLDGAAVESDCGIDVGADASLSDLKHADIVFVVSGRGVQTTTLDPALGHRLRALESRGAMIGALCTGAYVLAKLRMLDGYECTIHWESLRTFREMFPQLAASEVVFKIDRNRLTCAGGNSAFDMMLALISEEQGHDFARQIAEAGLHQHMRRNGEAQRPDMSYHLGTHNPKIIQAVELMREYIEEPVTCQQLAEMTHISMRQLERLFQRHLGSSPGLYYIRLRLQAARDLLRDTPLSILEVAIANGFASASHFSKCYLRHFGHTPSEERHQAQITGASHCRVQVFGKDEAVPVESRTLVASRDLSSCPRQPRKLQRPPAYPVRGPIQPADHVPAQAVG